MFSIRDLPPIVRVERLIVGATLAMSVAACGTEPGLGDGGLADAARRVAPHDASVQPRDGAPADGGPPERPPAERVPELASRSRGVAPLSVVFDATSSDAIARPPESDGRREYADLHYAWDFDDASAGTWAVDGRSRNGAIGYVAAHVFETPGVYDVRLTVSDASGVLGRYVVSVEVEDPDVVYAGEATVCVSNTEQFVGCPADARTLGGAGDLAAVAPLIASGTRVLLRRGDRFAASETVRLRLDGPFTLGAFGDCERPDARGICANAPLIESSLSEGSVFDDDRGGTRDLRVMDLTFVDLAGGGANAMWGGYEMRQILWLRLAMTGFAGALGAGHWETRGHDEITVANCRTERSRGQGAYIGARRLALLGNRFADGLTSHVVRVWHAPLSVIAHNDISGSSVESDSGRHALKLHGPREELLTDPGPTGLDERTHHVVIAHNVFGGSGPWPVAIGPQNGVYDERLSDILVVGNRFLARHGTPSVRPVQRSLVIWARHVTVVNNVFSGDGAHDMHYSGVSVGRRGSEPPPLGVRVLHNTFFRGAGGRWSYAVRVGEEATGTVIRNNFAQLEGATLLAEELGEGTLEADNLLTEDAALVDPRSDDPLGADFRPTDRSPGRDEGGEVPVFDDLDGARRPAGAAPDLGAFEGG